MRQFVADASHELRTPITATAAYAELFERGARDRPDDLERAMTGIRSETARMADLVEDLLLLAQLDEGRPIARHAGRSRRPRLRGRRRGECRRTRSPGEVACRRRPRGDRRPESAPSGARQPAGERAHPHPARHCRVRSPSAATETTLSSSVADEGPGCTRHDAARAFDRFHRADTSRARASGGAGLGLSIVAAIVAAHHGSVAMSSSPATGTTVTVRLPIVEGDAVNDVMWYLSRSTGIVAAVLAVAALAWGFLFSARETGTRYRPAWWLDLHNWLGGLALIFTIAHIATSYLDSDAGLSLASLFVPGIATSQRLALAWGVVATYLIATTVLHVLATQTVLTQNLARSCTSAP